MVTILIWILLAVIAIPVACVVAWNFFKLFLAIISDLGGLIFALMVFAIVMLMFAFC